MKVVSLIKKVDTDSASYEIVCSYSVEPLVGKVTPIQKRLCGTLNILSASTRSHLYFGSSRCLCRHRRSPRMSQTPHQR